MGDYDYDDASSHLARGRISSGGQISLYSASSESLDDFERENYEDEEEQEEEEEVEEEDDLTDSGPEPEAWSVTIDKKIIKRLGLDKKGVERQNLIYELIQTEKHHRKTLKIMKKVGGREGAWLYWELSK